MANNRVILASDGDFNVGVREPSELLKLIESKKDNGIYLTILGFGIGNFKDSRFEQLSNAGNGNYAYIDNIMEAKKVFGHELWGTLYAIADDVKIQIEFNPSVVKSYRLVGYENRILNHEDFEDDTKDAGEIGSGHVVTALYELILEEENAFPDNFDTFIYQDISILESDDLMTLSIRYKQPGNDQSELIQQKMTKSQILLHNPSENFSFASAVAQFGMLLRNSPFKGESSYDNVIKPELPVKKH